MKKNVWIINHYATNMYFDEGERHYWFAKYLKRAGYNPTVFCAATIHNSTKSVDINGQKYGIKRATDGFDFVFIRTPQYHGYGYSRIKNMLTFAISMYRYGKEYAKKYGKPDFIMASSPHPLTIIAGIFLAKHFNIKCMGEVRDLWPLSIISYGLLNKKSIIAKILYLGEHWIYKHADYMNFTMQGGKKYIQQQKWDKDNGGDIDLSKVLYINNGVDMEKFEKNRNEYFIKDEVLDNSNDFSVAYTGSIRLSNNVEMLVNVAICLQNKGIDNIKFVIYGSGPELEKLKLKAKENKLQNIVFRGYVNKKYVPSIVCRASLNFFHVDSTPLLQYGYSLNKAFEYLATGKPILKDFNAGEYDYILNSNAGFYAEPCAEKIALKIIEISRMSKDALNQIGRNAKTLAYQYDFKTLTDKLVEVIEK